MRQVILKFVVVHIGVAEGRFDRIVVGPDGYEKNQEEREHPKEFIESTQ